MRFITREECMANNYRKVEAVFRRGKSIDEIVKTVGIPKMDVLDIIQKIYHLDTKKRMAR